MNEIKEYKPLALVFYMDGNGNRDALPLDDSKVNEFQKVIENTKMVELEWVTINTYEIKEIRRAWKTTEIEKFYYARNYTERAMIAQRIKNRCNNQKANVIEELSSLGTQKAIELMQRWIEWANAPKQEVTTTIQQQDPITQQQKIEIRAKYQNILNRLSK